MTRRECIEVRNKPAIVNLIGKQTPSAGWRGAHKRALTARDVFEQLNNRTRSQNGFNDLAAGSEGPVVIENDAVDGVGPGECKLCSAVPKAGKEIAPVCCSP